MSPSHSHASDHAADKVSMTMDMGSTSSHLRHEPTTVDSAREATGLTDDGHDGASQPPSTTPPAQPVSKPPPEEMTRSASTNSRRLPMPHVTPGRLAFSALQFLPVPLLVLSRSKTVAMANDAMGRLLGMIPGTAGDQRSAAVLDGLLGQSLSQVGVDMAQEGRPIWVDWEQFLDALISKMGPLETRQSSNEGNDSTAMTGGVDGSLVNAAHTPSQNAVIEVIITRKDLNRTAFDSGAHPNVTPFQICATMIVTVWELGETQTYFTLTFTIDESQHLSYPLSRVASEAVVDEAKRLSAPNSNAPPECSIQTHESPLSIRVDPASVSLTSSPFLPSNSPSKASKSSALSILQKIIVMKDALLDSTDTPILAMWKDGSVVFPNRAARKLFSTNKPIDVDSYTDGFDLLPAWNVWDEDYTRQLEPEEYPISALIRTEKPFTGRRIGMYDSEGRKLVFEVVGEVIRDDTTGEFFAGVVSARDVTKVTEMITRIKEQDEERFKLMCDTMPQLVWTATPEGMHDFYNTRWYNYTGMSEADTLGLGWRSAFHPDDLEESDRLWEHSLRTGEPYVTEYRCRSKEGEWKWFIGRALPLRNKHTFQVEKWFGTCTEANESIETRLVAKRTRQQLLSVIAHSHVTIFTVDLNRKVTMLEGALIWDTLGDNSSMDAAESPWYIGENVYEVFNRLNSQLPDGQRPQFLEPIESILAGLPTEDLDLQEHEIDGHFFRTRFLPVFGKRNIDGRMNESALEGVIGVILDVTELKSKEADIEAQAKEKQQLVANEAAAKEASRLKSQFLANMSHEVRTPITGVLGMAELLLDLELGQEQREYTENIYRSASALLTVINDILDLSKVESGRLDIEEVQFSLSVIISDVSKMLSFAVKRKNLDFQSDIGWDIENDLVVMGDPGRVRQIITNILTNSIKFTNNGYVKFSVLKERETADVIEIKFVIEDTGIGIEDSVRRRLFQPFSQGDASTARKFGGTGLGLAISKNLLELMNGRITLESTLGVGTTASFCIPFNKPQEPHAANPVRIERLPERLQSEVSVSCNSSEYEHVLGLSPTEAISPLDKPRLSWHKKTISSLSPGLLSEDDLAPIERQKINILVVEDNAINQQIATKTIKKLGFNVTAAWNGREALDYLTAAQEGKRQKPDIILMDVQMPVIDGYKCTHLLRHHLPYKKFISNVPIIAMTASAIQGDKEKCQKAGMDDYLAKPVKSKTLERMLVRWSITKRRPTISPSLGSETSDCSETSEKCETASIPGIGHDGGDLAMPSEGIEDTRSPLAGQPLNVADLDGTTQYSGVDALTPPDTMATARFPESDELAMQSRDDKLINLAETSTATKQGHHSVPHSLQAPLPVGEALTEENMEKLEKEASSKRRS